MAQIQLRDCTIRFKDGTLGSATVDTNTPTANDSSVDLTANSVNMPRATDSTLVPVGARFTVNTANNTTIYTVTSRDPLTNAPTTSINFSPMWGDETPAKNDVITFQPQQINIHIGEGNLTYTEHVDYKYTLDRGLLDTVKFADEKPVDMKTDFLYEFVTTGTKEDITPVDALKQINGAAEWVSSSSDQCEPYSIDIEIFHHLPCVGTENEVTLIPVFRYETLEFNLKDGTIAVTGKCNVVQASVSRTATLEGDLERSA